MTPKNILRSDALVGFYRFWHGKLHWKGSGVLLRLAAGYFGELERYHLAVPNIGCLTVNFRDSSGFAWLNYSLREPGHEEGMITALKNLAPKNPVVWDIGANAGFFVAALAQNLEGYACILMFEPNPKLMPGLHELAACLVRAQAHNLAFSNVSGQLVLHVPPGSSSIASLTPQPNTVAVPVACTTGDLFLQASGAEDPDVIVIDTEGNDANVILGLKELIRRKRPIIFFENIFLSETVIRQTLPENYQYFTVDDLSGELLPEWNPNRGHNSVYVPLK